MPEHGKSNGKWLEGRSFAATDHRAAALAELGHETQKPYLTILFGSRVRGDYAEGRSNIDIMVVRDDRPNEETLKNNWLVLEKRKLELYPGQHINTDVIPFTVDEFFAKPRDVNGVADRAADDGYILGHQARDCRTLARRRRIAYHRRCASTQLGYLESETNADDQYQGAQAREAVKKDLEAVVYATGEWCPEVHDIGMLLDLARRADPGGTYETELDPEIYSQYFYSRRNVPVEVPFTSNPNTGKRREGT